MPRLLQAHEEAQTQAHEPEPQAEGAAQTAPSRRRRRWHWQRTLVLVVLAYAAFMCIRQEGGFHKLDTQTAAAQQQLQMLQASNDQLQQRLADMSSKTSLEREARGMGLVKPGEVVYEPDWGSSESAPQP